MILSQVLTPAVVYFIGMSKNAGKTSVMNKAIDLVWEKEVLGISSFGRDGEQLDLVTSTPKPSIYIKKGSLVATAKDLLGNCDITYEILATTPMRTPLGRILILRALSDGFVDLAGPSTGSEIQQLIDLLQDLGASKVFIDGALSRKAIVKARPDMGLILSTGASYHDQWQKIAADTLEMIHRFDLPRAPEEISSLLGSYSGSLWSMSQSGKIYQSKQETSLGEIGSFLQEQDEAIKVLYVGGAITATSIQKLLENRKQLKGASLVIDSPLHLITEDQITSRLAGEGITCLVRNRIDLMGVSVNPYGANRPRLKKGLLEGEIRKHTALPVFNIRDEGND